MQEAAHRLRVPGSSAEAEHLLPLGKGGCVSHRLGISAADIRGEKMLSAQTQLEHGRVNRRHTHSISPTKRARGKEAPVLRSGVNTHSYELQTL